MPACYLRTRSEDSYLCSPNRASDWHPRSLRASTLLPKEFTSAGRTRTTVCATHRALLISKDQVAPVQSADQVLLFRALSNRDAAAALNVVYFASFPFTGLVEARLGTLAVQLLSYVGKKEFRGQCRSPSFLLLLLAVHKVVNFKVRGFGIENSSKKWKSRQKFCPRIALRHDLALIRLRSNKQ